MTRSEHIRALLEEYAAQRARDDAELNARVEAAERRDPEIARLRADSVSLALGTMRTILSLPTQEARVEAAQRMEHIGPAAECGAADPENVAGVVVLALVGLDLSEDAPPAERIAEKVDKSARSTCIFEFRAVGP